MDNKEFGRFISELRKEKNYTQKQVADKIHVTDKAVSKWETGKGLPDIGNIEALADVYSVSIGEIMRCKRYDANEARVDDIQKVIDNTLDVVHYQKQLRRYKLLFIFVFGLIGAALMISGLYFMNNPFMMSDNSGSTSYFIVGKVPLLPCWGAFLTGAFCITAALLQMKKR